MASDYSATTQQLFSTTSQAIGLASLSAGRISGTSRPSLRNPSLNFTPKNVNLGEVPKFSDLFNAQGSANSLIGELDQNVDDWLAKYFPSINGSFRSLPEDWCAEVIGGTRPFGTDSTVFDQVWHQARDRAYRTASSEQQQLAASLSSRGFSLPIGAYVDAISLSEQRATAAVLDVNREQAIKDADIKADLLKQAVSIAADLKQGILSTAADYFRSYYSVHGMGNDTARIRAQAYQSFYGALSNYYGLELSVEELRLRAAEGKAGIDISSDRNRIGLYSGDNAAQAHAQASRGFADIAANAANAAGSLTAQIEQV
jgi:hypothetical protein